jgi:hypothetical protein
MCLVVCSGVRGAHRSAWPSADHGRAAEGPRAPARPREQGEGVGGRVGHGGRCDSAQASARHTTRSKYAFKKLSRSAVDLVRIRRGPGRISCHGHQCDAPPCIQSAALEPGPGHLAWACTHQNPRRSCRCRAATSPQPFCTGPCCSGYTKNSDLSACRQGMMPRMRAPHRMTQTLGSQDIHLSCQTDTDANAWKPGHSSHLPNRYKSQG